MLHFVVFGHQDPFDMIHVKVGQQRHLGPKQCAASGIKHQFDKWHLSRVPTGTPSPPPPQTQKQKNPKCPPTTGRTNRTQPPPEENIFENFGELLASGKKLSKTVVKENISDLQTHNRICTAPFE